MKILDKGDHYKVKISLAGEKVIRRFPYDRDSEASKKQAHKDARYWVDTRSTVASNARVSHPNIDESISTIGGKMYLYLRLRKCRKIIKSISVGRIADRTDTVLEARRQDTRYKEALAQLQQLHMDLR